MTYVRDTDKSVEELTRAAEEVERTIVAIIDESI